MTLVVLVALAAALAFIPPALAHRLHRSHPARLVTLGMLHLLGLVLVPLALVASALELFVRRHGSFLADASGLAVVAVVVARGALAGLSTRRTWRRVAAALPAAGQPGPRGSTIVALVTPTAFTAGRQVVVSRALVDLLDPFELDAVIIHEQAHVAGGHGRLAALAAALAAGAWGAPPARRSLRMVREGLELLADHHALTELSGAAPIASAVAKLAASGEAASGSKLDGGFVDRRLDCLTASASVSAPMSRAVDLITALVGAGIVFTVCAALHLHLAAVGVLVCLTAAAALVLVLRPMRSAA